MSVYFDGATFRLVYFDHVCRVERRVEHSGVVVWICGGEDIAGTDYKIV